MPPGTLPWFGSTGLPGVPLPVPKLLAIFIGVLSNGPTCIRSLRRLGDVCTEYADIPCGGWYSGKPDIKQLESVCRFEVE